MINRQLRVAIASLCISLTFVAAYAETIALIGTGEVSAALGPRFAQSGHTVIFGSRSPKRADVQELVKLTGKNATAASPPEAAANADIVMLNVPWNVAEEVARGLGDLTGKIVLDPVNPRIIAEDGFRDFPTYTSNAERIQNILPTAHVVKAFNTMSTETMIDPDLYDYPISIPIAGNNAAAKRRVTNLLEGMGYQVVDFGPVRYAHIVEGLYLVRTNSRDVLGQAFEYHFFKREGASEAVR